MRQECKDCPQQNEPKCCHNSIRPLTAFPRLPVAAQPTQKPNDKVWNKKQGIFSDLVANRKWGVMA